MSNFEIKEDEVILYEARLSGSLLGLNNSMYLTLTSKRIIIEEITKKSGLLNKKDEKKLFEEIELKDIKTFNNKTQVNQKGNKVTIQAVKSNITLEFSGTIEAMKFVTKVTDAITNKTLTDRSFDKVKETFDKVDDVLGFDTRGTVKGVLENGIGRTLFKGIGIGKSKSTKKKKKNT